MDSSVGANHKTAASKSSIPQQPQPTTQPISSSNRAEHDGKTVKVAGLDGDYLSCAFKRLKKCAS
ncbi:hypothetical protein HanRHA438_Chr09g0386741 [Helianthus annuus]|nr:hypothetical protein HanRHA438_Chr09g0386741 [Helianthus annuus]